jgi:hypothetical protein
MSLTILQKEAILRLLPKMTTITAMTCMEAFLKEYQVRIDWHYFSNYLDELHTKGLLKIVDPGGMTGYALNSEEK